MNRTARLEMLVRIVDQGSLAGAARSLGLTASAVSRALAELEQSMGTTLLRRSTRSLTLTDDGQLVYDRAREILAQLADLDATVALRRRRVGGTLRIGMPIPIGRYIVWPRLSQLLERHPDLDLVCLPIQDPKAMQDENFDVMLIAGEPPASRLVARRLAIGRPAIYASAEYLRRRGAPRTPQELADHQCLAFHGPWMRVPATEWHFSRGKETTAVRISPRVISSDREGLIVAALGGAGLIRMACFDPRLIAADRLQRVLAQWTCTDGFPVYALHRKGATAAPRVQAFMAFVREAFDAFDPEQATLLRG